ncbi:hypothetical protein M0Q50_02495 [bacterium]|jgi:hypothetical protein|nr:hypothetical protein [bacterium]
MNNISNANAICLICGSTKQNNTTSLCINDHDDWLEEIDDASRFSKAMIHFNLNINDIIFAIQNNIDLIPVK